MNDENVTKYKRWLHNNVSVLNVHFKIVNFMLCTFYIDFKKRPSSYFSQPIISKLSCLKLYESVMAYVVAQALLCNVMGETDNNLMMKSIVDIVGISKWKIM